MQWPEELTANAWTGTEPATGGLSDSAAQWALGDHFAGRPASHRAAQQRPDHRDWLDRRVGWGIVLPDVPGLSHPERARADDAPEPFQRLAAARSATGQPIVLRYERDDVDQLYRYYPDGARHPIPTTGDGPRGAGRGELPYYLLLAGSPVELPWDLQFQLNHVCYTGRLDLDDSGLGNYVEAALSGWASAAVDSSSPLMWSVQHRPGDITWLMRQGVGERALAAWRTDTQIGDRAVGLREEHATCARLATTLAERRPGVVVTTSHGMTGPDADPERLRRTLGRLVDVGHDLLEPDRLLSQWSPDGVVWYALACCSAGGSGRHQFDGLLQEGTRAARAVERVVALGPVTAELPRALLGAARPARAFIGHVEPAFDWTLRRADTGLVTTSSLITALYDEFFQARPTPVGYAFRQYYLQSAALRSRWSTARQLTGEAGAPSTALLCTLAGIDRQCTVILGDPAVAPAALPCE
ncbi:hypothetical protein ACPCHT_33105 [Nucisporomicrobium flavum]|uniref:hypothetical protein n=1 Tax=Nucisporomicrobium flavum TaxID=2785915 RepID=UPI003C2F9702